MMLFRHRKIGRIKKEHAMDAVLRMGIKGPGGIVGGFEYRVGLRVTRDILGA